ncbi:type II secretion system protein M [Shewanella sp. Isolate11]|uniref:type II secretion system protein M n=1 Tax=Shewanella sp. Isolate11 TaxID=2908530 RepID=UPI001EFEAB56|nr:type II secretion system protein M [Shewanella sp. Isolate11]MCG9695475.1 type II secretion system protein M [Shewanella sp. Isolate11]
MKRRWSLAAERFNQLSPRERGMVSIAVVAVVGLLLYLPLEAQLVEHQQLQQQVKSITDENNTAVAQIALYKQTLAQDPDEEYRSRQARLNQQMAAIDKQLAFEMVDMVPAKHMPAMLSELLGRIKGVKLLGFDTIAPTPLLSVGEQDKLNVYSHGMKLTLEGDYFSTLSFIQAVENMPNKLYWKQLDYAVTQYPKANVVLELYSLSINKDFISVAN